MVFVESKLQKLFQTHFSSTWRENMKYCPEESIFEQKECALAMVVQLHHHKYIFTDFLWVVYVICYSTPGESAQQYTVYLQALSIVFVKSSGSAQTSSCAFCPEHILVVKFSVLVTKFKLMAKSQESCILLTHLAKAPRCSDLML